MALLAAAAPTSAFVLRAGQALLALSLLGVLGLAFALAIAVPHYAWLLPVGMLALVPAGLLLRRPYWATYAAVGLSVLALDKVTGFQPSQVFYGLFVYAFFAAWYFRHLWTRTAFVHNGLDKAFAVLLFVGFPAAVVIGVLLGGNLMALRGEVITFTMLGFYFPIKEACRKDRWGPEILAALVILIGVFVATRSFLNFQNLLLRATEAWQVADVRLSGGTALNEMHLLFATIFALVLLVYAKKRFAQFGMTIPFLMCLVALIMTKSRGYWIDLFLALIVLGVVLRGRERLGLGALLIGGTTLTVGVLFMFFGPLVSIILDGTLLRLASLGTAATDDISLINRFGEAKAVIDKARLSPIVGWGLGSEFAYFDIIDRATLSWEFIHNGYVALWFKLGLWGAPLMLGIWGVAAWHGMRLYRSSTAPRVHRAIALAAAVSLIALLPSTATSSPFFTRELLQAMVFQFAIAAGMYQRYTVPMERIAPSP